MKPARRKPVTKIPSGVCSTISLVVLALAMTFTTTAQPTGTPPTTAPPTPLNDRNPAGQPERVDLGNGKFKRIYRNRAGQIIQEETFEGGGGMLQPEVLIERRHIHSVNANGNPAMVTVQGFIDIPDTLGGRRQGSIEHYTYNEAGEPIEKIQLPLDCNGNSTGVRAITTWAAGTRESTHRVQRWDEPTKSWKDFEGQPKPPANTGPGQTSSNTKLPNGATATAETRVRANGDDSLLISLTSPEKFDSLQITLPSSRPFSVGYLPPNWTMKQDGRKLLFGGPASDTIDVRLDAPKGGETISDKPIEIEPAFAKKTLFEKRISTTKLPPITSVNDLSSALNLPPEITPGQPFLATPKPGFTDGTWRIADGPAGQWINTGDPNYRPLLFKVAENAAPIPKDRTVLRFGYFDKYNELMREADAELRFSEFLESRIENALLPSFPEFALAGQSTCGQGNFPKWEDWFFYSIDGTTPLLPVSASPTTITFAIPATVTPGSHVIARSCPATGQLKITVLGVEGSIDKNALWRGESTLMRLRVIGTDESLPIAIRNNTPEIIDMQGGVQQTVNSTGGAANLVNRAVSGIKQGNFNIDYWLDYSRCGDGKRGAPEK